MKQSAFDLTRHTAQFLSTSKGALREKNTCVFCINDALLGFAKWAQIVG